MELPHRVRQFALNIAFGPRQFHVLLRHVLGGEQRPLIDGKELACKQPVEGGSRLRVRLQAARDHVGDRWGAVLGARARRLARQLTRP